MDALKIIVWNTNQWVLDSAVRANSFIQSRVLPIAVDSAQNFPILLFFSFVWAILMGVFSIAIFLISSEFNVSTLISLHGTQFCPESVVLANCALEFDSWGEELWYSNLSDESSSALELAIGGGDFEELVDIVEDPDFFLNFWERFGEELKSGNSISEIYVTEMGSSSGLPREVLFSISSWILIKNSLTQFSTFLPQLCVISGLHIGLIVVACAGTMLTLLFLVSKLRAPSLSLGDWVGILFSVLLLGIQLVIVGWTCYLLLTWLLAVGVCYSPPFLIPLVGKRWPLVVWALMSFFVWRRPAWSFFHYLPIELVSLSLLVLGTIILLCLICVVGEFLFQCWAFMDERWGRWEGELWWYLVSVCSMLAFIVLMILAACAASQLLFLFQPVPVFGGWESIIVQS